MTAYTITNEYVELITDNGRVRCEIQGIGRNRYITLDNKSYLLQNIK